MMGIEEMRKKERDGKAPKAPKAPRGKMKKCRGGVPTKNESAKY